MSYEKVAQVNTESIIGTKQVLKAIKNGYAKEVIIASDADPHITSKITQVASDHQVPCFFVDSMKKLGKACGIDVGAATVAIKQ
ncbi:50S ribosomal protein L7ae-like protein [Gracilibacillus caseinilyticus]|uniref:RNA-binding protein MUN88_04985 n=1 Tax=Gracilibacillus caseinilyticus TaxID=2932256 RepID=A0ABY4EYI0_9BACI|nr:50S ribosomal protein L7ae-like protein [Gracilibacillus caseinilyticus]UOQ49462.1 50S ribosomal protein L7ae-like protein [Gracilibacillus caseinilyticus]